MLAFFAKVEKKNGHTCESLLDLFFLHHPLCEGAENHLSGLLSSALIIYLQLWYISPKRIH